jgi:hypothetical protein
MRRGPFGRRRLPCAPLCCPVPLQCRAPAVTIDPILPPNCAKRIVFALKHPKLVSHGFVPAGHRRPLDPVDGRPPRKGPTTFGAVAMATRPTRTCADLKNPRRFRHHAVRIASRLSGFSTSNEGKNPPSWSPISFRTQRPDGPSDPSTAVGRGRQPRHRR